MKRHLRFWTGAVAGSLVLAGCATTRPAAKVPHGPDVAFQTSSIPAESEIDTRIQPVSHQIAASANSGETTEFSESMTPKVVVTAVSSEPVPPNEQLTAQEVTGEQFAAAAVPINLPTALAMIGGQHPIVGFAQWRVQEAYAQLDSAKAMWLPSIQSGFNYRRRDGNYQAVDGTIVDVNLNSMNYGLGTGAVAAGTSMFPGIYAQFHFADAIFLPKAAQKTAWARGHAAAATLNQQLLNGGIAYIDLLEAYQDYEIIAEAVRRTSDLVTLTENFAEAGEGLQSDADRTATELSLLQTRQLAVHERQLVASTRLARVLSIPMTSTMLPQDTVAVPLDLLPQGSDEPTLIARGLASRPELKESQALVAAACEAYKREKYAPFVPSVLLGFSATSFGGGRGSSADNFGGRYDLDALMVWQVRDLGFGEGAARREKNSQIQQATFAKLRILDQVAQEVAEANVQVGIRRQQIEMAQTAIGRARDSYQRNMDRIRDAQGLPIEALQSIQALEAAQRAYMRAVVDYNRAQLQLQWALGWPVNSSALPEITG